jgi:putative transposase
MDDDELIFFRRKLPHIQPKDSLFFITFRLFGSLPANIITALREEYESEVRLLKEESQARRDHFDPSVLHRWYFERFDEFLEKYSESPKYLSNNAVAQTIADSIQHWNDKRYTVVCYCIMPNHVHMVIDIGGFTVDEYRNKTSYRLSRIMETLKGYTAKAANKILSRNGHFWQKESYDHVVRDGNELNRIIRYVMDNPVKAGLVSIPEEWKWTYVNEKYFIL